LGRDCKIRAGSTRSLLYGLRSGLRWVAALVDPSPIKIHASWALTHRAIANIRRNRKIAAKAYERYVVINTIAPSKQLKLVQRPASVAE